MKLENVFLDFRTMKSCKEVSDYLTNISINNILINSPILTIDKEKLPNRVSLMVEVKNEIELDFVNQENMVLSDNELVLSEARKKGCKAALFTSVTNQQTLESAWQKGIKYDALVISFKDPTNIPLELVIAEIENNHAATALYKVVESAEDAKIAAQVLERGADGVIIRNITMQNLENIEAIQAHEESVDLQEVIVDSIEYIGMGDRCCIDTTSLMNQTEGMIIGSTSVGGIFVCSETHYLPYMELRPFRINAGGVHSYVKAPNNTTRYLSELTAGKTLSCINADGKTRVVTVGRNKIERRPMLLIKGKIGKVEINVILQDDWHVRVMGADRKPKNITELKSGDKLLGCLMQQGRHVGLNVRETITEK